MKNFLDAYRPRPFLPFLFLLCFAIAVGLGIYALASYAPIDHIVWVVGGIGLLLVAPLTGFGVWVSGKLVRESEELRRAREALNRSAEVSNQRAKALQSLVDAARELTGGTNLDRLLEQTLDAARSLTGARYAALGVFDETGEQLARFITLGIDAATREAIGTLPTGRGLLGRLDGEKDVARLKDLSRHPASVGFPLHHPSMRSFLGAVIRTHGRLFGRLYLTEKEGAEEFTDIDEQVIMGLASLAGEAIEDAVLMRQLRAVEGDLRKLNAELELRVHQRTAELEVANKELEAFSYSVAHDLRAPLRSIVGFSQALLEEYSGKLDEEGHDYLGRIKRAGERMFDLIEDFLILSHITRAELHRKSVNLTELARSIVETLQGADPERRVEVVIQEGLWAAGDPELLRVVLENLLGNAWKFTRKRTQARIEFGIMHHEGQPTYVVRDNGAGFDMAYADKLFSPFQRLHPPTEFEGTGIGLATVQRVVHRHGGRAWAEGAVGQGATVYFTL